MSKILIVPTYRHLSDPLIERVISFFGNESQYFLLTFDERGASYNSESISHEKFVTRAHITSKNSFLGSIKAQKMMLKFLDEHQPDHIVTFSDLTLFSRAIQWTHFEAKTIIIQPSATGRIPDKFIYQLKRCINRLINFVFCAPIRQTHLNWGTSLKHATFFVWGNAELALFPKSVNAIGTGLLFTPYVNEKMVQEGLSHQKTNKILIIAPDLNFFHEASGIDEFFKEIDLLCATLEQKIYIKFHPLNRCSIPQIDNLHILDAIEESELKNYDVIVSGYSTLAITARCVNRNIIIYDHQSYPIAQIRQPYYEFAHSAQDIRTAIEAVYNKLEERSQQEDSYVDDVFYEDTAKLRVFL